MLSRIHSMHLETHSIMFLDITLLLITLLTTRLREILHRNRLLRMWVRTIDPQMQTMLKGIMRQERKSDTTRIIAISILRQFTILERRFRMPTQIPLE